MTFPEGGASMMGKGRKSCFKSYYWENGEDSEAGDWKIWQNQSMRGETTKRSILIEAFSSNVATFLLLVVEGPFRGVIILVRSYVPRPSLLQPIPRRSSSHFGPPYLDHRFIAWPLTLFLAPQQSWLMYLFLANHHLVRFKLLNSCLILKLLNCMLLYCGEVWGCLAATLVQCYRSLR